MKLVQTDAAPPAPTELIQTNNTKPFCVQWMENQKAYEKDLIQKEFAKRNLTVPDEWK